MLKKGTSQVQEQRIFLALQNPKNKFQGMFHTLNTKKYKPQHTAGNVFVPQ